MSKSLLIFKEPDDSIPKHVRQTLFKIFYLFGCIRSYLWHAISFICGMWHLVLRPGMEPDPLHWEHGVLATEPPGKSHLVSLY